MGGIRGGAMDAHTRTNCTLLLGPTLGVREIDELLTGEEVLPDVGTWRSALGLSFG